MFSIGVDTRSGGLWQLEEVIKAIQEVVKDSEGVGGVGAFVVSQFASSFPHTAKSNYVNPLPPPCLCHLCCVNVPAYSPFSAPID